MCDLSTFSLVQVADSSPILFSDMNQFALSNGIPTVAKSYESEPPKDGFPVCMCSRETFENSTGCRGPEKLTAWLVASRAKTFPWLEKAKESMGNVPDFGERWPESLAKFDRVTSSWKTAQYSLAGGLAEYSETWPRSGSMRNGIVFRRAKSGRHTHAKGCSFWPTPRASDGDGSGLLHRTCKGNLRDAVRRRFGKGPMNPEFSEWLMGFPKGYTALRPSETPNVHRRPPSHGENCMGGLIVDSLTTK